jgi:transcriptional regulator with XRE-family HTH domain
MSELAELFTSDTYSDRVAAEVRAHAARRGLQQQDLAHALGYQQPQISKRLRGLVPFTINEIAALAALLDIQPSDLLPQSWAPRGSNPEPMGFASPQVSAGVIILPSSAERTRRTADRRRTSGPGRARPFGPPAPHLDHEPSRTRLDLISC